MPARTESIYAAQMAAYIPTRCNGVASSKRIMQAHRIHHIVETKEGTVSFGFLIAPKPEDLKAELQARGRAGVRAPRGVSSVTE